MCILFRNRFLLCAWILALFFLASAPLGADATTYRPPSTARANYNFNLGWKFIRDDIPAASQPEFDDSAWFDVSTPHTWNDVDSYRKFIRHSGGDQTVFLGIGWYRKHFKLPSEAKGQKVFLEFEGLKQAGRFFLNGKPLGKYENGVTALGLDLTNAVNFDGHDNVLAVKVDNSAKYVEEATNTAYQWMAKDFNPNFGGLNHDVRLHIMGKIYQTLPLYENLQTSGVYIYPKNIDVPNRTAEINIESQVRNESGDYASISLSVAIVDASGIVQAAFDGNTTDLVDGQTETLAAAGPMKNLRFWSPDDPVLYDVYSVLSVNGKALDVCKTRTGFRKVEFKGGAGTGGVYLNDKFIWLTGYAQRSVNDWAGLGQAYPDWLHDYNAQLIKASHANYVRWMHIAPHAVDVRACDRFGIVEVCPAGDKERDVEGRQWQQRVEAMRDTIISYRNNPSIFFWEAGNQAISPDHMQEMVELRKKWDPEGLRAMGVRHGDNNAAATALTPIAEYYGVMIGQDARTDQLDSPTAVFRGYSAERRNRAPLIETEDLRDEAFRSIWDDASPPHFGFKKGPEDTWNWNSETFALQAVRRYNSYMINRIDNPDPTHSKWAAYASIYWSDSDADGRQQSSAVLRVSGKVDSVRLPKEAFYTYQVLQGSQPSLHLIGHWTYPANTQKTVYVIGKGCDAIELSINGHAIGKNTAPTDGYIYAFPDVHFTPGTIKAVGTKDGKIVAQQEIKTAGAPSAIRVTATLDPAGFLADGADVALIDFEVVDAEGNRCPTDEARVDFSVTGPAIWRGGINSAIEGSTNNLYLNTECGINRVAIRSTFTPGSIKVTATRAGLKSSTITLETKPINEVGGLMR